MRMLPWPVWPLAEHARLGQNTVVGSMTVLLVVLGSMPRGVCLDPRFLYKYASPRLNAELPRSPIRDIPLHDPSGKGASVREEVVNVGLLIFPELGRSMLADGVDESIGMEHTDCLA